MPKTKRDGQVRKLNPQIPQQRKLEVKRIVLPTQNYRSVKPKIFATAESYDSYLYPPQTSHTVNSITNLKFNRVHYLLFLLILANQFQGISADQITTYHNDSNGSHALSNQAQIPNTAINTQLEQITPINNAAPKASIDNMSKNLSNTEYQKIFSQELLDWLKSDTASHGEENYFSKIQQYTSNKKPIPIELLERIASFYEIALWIPNYRFKASRWYYAAYTYGSLNALVTLGVINYYDFKQPDLSIIVPEIIKVSYDNKPLHENMQRALEMWQEAAAHDIPGAFFYLGFHYTNIATHAVIDSIPLALVDNIHSDHPAERKLAKEYLLKWLAYRPDDPEGNRFLGIIYYIENNFIEGNKRLELAASEGDEAAKNIIASLNEPATQAFLQKYQQKFAEKHQQDSLPINFNFDLTFAFQLIVSAIAMLSATAYTGKRCYNFWHNRQLAKAEQLAKQQAITQLLNQLTSNYCGDTWQYKNGEFSLALALNDKKIITDPVLYQDFFRPHLTIEQIQAIHLDNEKITTALMKILSEYNPIIKLQQNNQQRLVISSIKLKDLDDNLIQTKAKKLKQTLFNTSPQSQFVEIIIELERLKSHNLREMQTRFAKTQDTLLTLDKEIQAYHAILAKIHKTKEFNNTTIEKAADLIKRYKDYIKANPETENTISDTVNSDITDLQQFIINSIESLTSILASNCSAFAIKNCLELVNLRIEEADKTLKFFETELQKYNTQLNESAFTKLKNIYTHQDHVINDKELNSQLRTLTDNHAKQIKELKLRNEDIAYQVKQKQLAETHKKEWASEREQYLQKKKVDNPQDVKPTNLINRTKERPANKTSIVELKLALTQIQIIANNIKNITNISPIIYQQLANYVINFLELARHWEGNKITRLIKNVLNHQLENIDKSLVIEFANDLFSPSTTSIKKVATAITNITDTNINSDEDLRIALKSLEHTRLFREYCLAKNPIAINLSDCLMKFASDINYFNELFTTELAKNISPQEAAITIHIAIGRHWQILNDLALEGTPEAILLVNSLKNNKLISWLALCSRIRYELSHGIKVIFADREWQEKCQNSLSRIATKFEQVRTISQIFLPVKAEDNVEYANKLKPC